jgi:hypothetical protein
MRTGPHRTDHDIPISLRSSRADAPALSLVLAAALTAASIVLAGCEDDDGATVDSGADRVGDTSLAADTASSADQGWVPEIPGGCSIAPPAGGCVRGQVNGCCDDFELPYQCRENRWQCPVGAVPWDSCCGYGAGCTPQGPVGPQCHRDGGADTQVRPDGAPPDFHHIEAPVAGGCPAAPPTAGETCSLPANHACVYLPICPTGTPVRLHCNCPNGQWQCDNGGFCQGP